MYDNFFTKATEFLAEGIPFALAVVVRAEKPTSAKPGDKALIAPTGVMHGWIGGSCAQPTVIKQAMEALADGEPRLIRLSTQSASTAERDGLLELPMTCFSGGTLEIYIEPQFPPPRLMVIGNLPVAQALIQLGKAMNYQVLAVDPDNEGAGMSQADQILTHFDDIVAKITPLTYVVVASHGQYDEIALEHALRSNATYVALVASKRRAASVIGYLKEQGLSENELGKLKYPAGLDIQARRGDEIALSIMAEIVQKRRNAELLDIEALFNDAIEPPAEAIDPICGMSVQIKNAHHYSDYDGQRFYFCCPGCKSTFERNPQATLHPTPPRIPSARSDLILPMAIVD